MNFNDFFRFSNPQPPKPVRINLNGLDVSDGEYEQVRENKKETDSTELIKENEIKRKE